MAAKILMHSATGPAPKPARSATEADPLAAGAFDAELDRLLAAGWRVVQDGPSGVQLAGAKRWRLLDGLCLAAGLALVWIVPALGAGLIVIALLDYWFLTKPQVRFLRRGGAG